MSQHVARPGRAQPRQPPVEVLQRTRTKLPGSSRPTSRFLSGPRSTGRPQRALLPFKGLYLLLLLGLLCAGCGADTPPRPSSPAALANVAVAKEGIYQIAPEELSAAGLGWEDIPADQLQLTHRGTPQPTWVEDYGDGPRLHFYGQASDSPYSAQSIYQLRPAQEAMAPAKPLAAQSTQAPVDSYRAQLRLEQNLVYMPLAGEGGIDTWLWLSLSAPGSQTFTATLDTATEQAGTLKLALWGSTEAAQQPDHQLRIWVNQQLVADERWDGAGRQIVEGQIPAGALRAGENLVRVEAPGELGLAAEISVVDWIELTYQRAALVQDDRATLLGDGQSIRLSGFSATPLALDVSDPQRPARVSLAEAGAAVLLATQAGQRYLLAGPRGLLRPAITAGSQPPQPAAADYLAIGPAELLEPLAPLLEQRRSQGLRAVAISAESLADHYGHGYLEPEAIRAFLREVRPRYALLVGDGSYDPRGYVTPPEANRLPTFLVPTEFGGVTASDVEFAMLDGDQLPDIALGRLPARSPAQLSALVEKLLAHEREPRDQPWRQRALAVADSSDPSFSTDAEQFLQTLGPRYQGELLLPEGGEQQVSAAIDEGRGVVAYFGHGSIGQWGQQRYLGADAIAALRNGQRLPLVINMTCLTGLFAHPRLESLAEALLWHPHGGAVVVLAPTSLTLPGDQSFLAQALARELAQPAPGSAGELLLRAWRQAPASNGGALDVLRTFLLFGDPAMPL